MANKIILENFERDTKRLDLKDGTKVVLGSRDDKGLVGTKQPEVELTQKQWDEVKTHPAVKGWLDTGAIRQFNI
jgi:hypothetical protein